MRTESEIVDDLWAAKQAESEAKTKRIELEEELIALLGAKEEGQQKHIIGDYKVTIEGKLLRKIDWKAFDANIASKIPVAMHPVKMIRELDVTGVKYLANNEPQLYRLLSSALTVTPAKTYVKIELGA
jgi:hypothetical protein